MADGKVSTWLKKAMDIISIVFPAIIAVVGAIGLANQEEVVSVIDMIWKISEIVLGAGASIASIVYNFIDDKKKIVA
ncbi:hypothetical protein [Treponema sp.]|uniref:hypothetical protein n=1 Tax=Treponema sp. TaxID=166 RepID=UPI00298E2CDF|nr:hypothetical protein [Treponema sp.]MCQ2242100.1 hypothetical protein [Treponema sp.]